MAQDANNAQEMLIMQTEDVRYSLSLNSPFYEEISGGSGMGLDPSGELRLTDQRLTFSWETSRLFRGTSRHSIDIPLDRINVYDGRVKVQAENPTQFGGDFKLVVYVGDSAETFLFPLLRLKEPEKWAKEITRVVAARNHSVKYEEYDECKENRIDAKIGFDFDQVRRHVSDTVGAVKPFAEGAANMASAMAPVAKSVAENVVEKAKPFMPIATAVAGVKHPVAAAVADVAVNHFSDKADDKAEGKNDDKNASA